MLPGNLLGTGKGVLVHAQPPIRLAFGILAVIAVIAAPALVWPGALLILAVTTITLLLTRPPARVLKRALLFGVALYLPLLALLLLPTALGFGDTGVNRALGIAGFIALKGIATLVGTLSVCAVMRAAELHDALGALPLPRTLRLILIQIVHQTGILLDESVRIVQVLRVRGQGRGAWRAGLTLPQVWLERIAGRALRTADAMEVRRYLQLPMPPFPALSRWRAADALAVGCGALFCIGAATLHFLR